MTDRLRAYAAAGRELGFGAEHIQGKRKNNRAEGSYVPIRLRNWNTQGFRSPGFGTVRISVCGPWVDHLRFR